MFCWSPLSWPRWQAAPAAPSRTPADKLQPAQRAAATAQPLVTATAQETESQKFGRLIKGVEGQSVYFSYDDFTIKSDYDQSIQAHAGVLRKTGRGTVVLEGNADE